MLHSDFLIQALYSPYTILRLHRSEIGVCISTEIVCKPSMLTVYIFCKLIEYRFYCWILVDQIDHNTQRQQIVRDQICDHDVGPDFECICKHVYMNTLTS